jgi:hypothetical protein
VGDKSRKLGNKGEKQMALKRERNIVEYENLDIASILTIEYYFKDPEWFDKKGIHAENISSGQRREKPAIQPKRCNKCNKAYQNSVRVDKSHSSTTYLNTGLFKGIPLIKDTCNECK